MTEEEKDKVAQAISHTLHGLRVSHHVGMSIAIDGVAKYCNEILRDKSWAQWRDQFPKRHSILAQFTRRAHLAVRGLRSAEEGDS